MCTDAWSKTSWRKRADRRSEPSPSGRGQGEGKAAARLPLTPTLSQREREPRIAIHSARSKHPAMITTLLQSCIPSAMRIRLAIACLALIVALAPNSLRADDRETKPRPNILFLFTDDQRADTIHALGNATIRTPNLDRLVASGFTFRNAYCMGSDVPAVCLPSRTMLLSGRSLFHLKDRRRDAATLPKSLGQFGYFTYHDGKSGNT